MTDRTDATSPRLTATETRLLDVLRSRPGYVFSRAELVGLVMPDAIVLERTIDVHVRALRFKLGKEAESIRTIRGGGYCFASSET